MNALLQSLEVQSAPSRNDDFAVDTAPGRTRGRSRASQESSAGAIDFAKWPKAVAKLTKDRDELLALYDYPAEH